jgi:hypothetical protein
VVRSVRACDILELSLVPSISIWLFLCWCYVLRWICCLRCYSGCMSTPGKLEKYAWPRWFHILQPTWPRSSVGRALGSGPD